MASGRSSLALLCVCSVIVVLMVSNVAVAHPHGDHPHGEHPHGHHHGHHHHDMENAGLTKQFYLRGNSNLPAQEAAMGEENVQATQEGVEFFERRELRDYVDPGSNCSKNCK